MVSNLISDDIEIIQSFVSESVDLLDEAEPNLIELQNKFESEGSLDAELVNTIFRLFHTLKGSAGFLELKNMERVTHHAENLLDLIRKKKMDLSPQKIDVILNACDLIRKILKQVEVSGSDEGFEEESDLLVEELVKVLDQGSEDKRTQDESQKEIAEDIVPQETSLKEAYSVYTEKLKKYINLLVDDQSVEKNIGTIVKVVDDFIERAKNDGFDDIVYVLSKIQVYLKGVDDKTIYHALENSAFILQIIDVITDSVDNIIKGEKKYMKGAQGLVAFIDSLIEEASPVTDNGIKKKNEIENDSEAQSESEPVVDQDFMTAFYQETEELLDSLENSLLEYMKDTESSSYPQEIFRSFHTIKGNCGIVGFSMLENMIHKIETFFDFVRIKKIIMTQEIIQVILELIDAIRESIQNLKKGVENYFVESYANMNIIDSAIEKVRNSGDDTKESESDKYSESQEKFKLKKEEKMLVTPDKDFKTETTKSEDKGFSSDKLPSTSEKVVPPQARFLQRSSIKVDLEKVDRLVNWVGELAIAESMVVQNKILKDIDDSDFENAVHNLHRIISEIQYVSLSLRMVSIEPTFKKMLRLVNDLSRKANKRINLQLRGENTEIDKSVVELIGDPLVHILRNSVDHGIETIDERREKGKNETGNILLRALHDAGEVHIIIKDDGKGLNHSKILEKAVAQGLVKDSETLSEQEINKLIFEPGFSTAEKVTEVSGRGVGMDVVKKNLEKVKGSIDVDSKRDKGTTIKLRIPLTMAIMDGMLVEVGANSYTIPLFAIREFFRPETEQITITPDGQEVVKVRNELIPIIRLYNIFKLEPASEDLKEGILIIVEDNKENYCLLVDNILGQQQAVIKSLPEYLENIQGISGCTILGNGEVSPILDLNAIISKIKNN